MVGWPKISNTQTYYNPSNKVDLTITIRESYKPIDYNKIGRDFNTVIQNEIQRRENLMRYYDEIYYQTKNAVYSSTVLTTDNLVNSKILMVQEIVIDYLDIYNRLLKSGSMKPNEYESNVRNIYYIYMNYNQVFLQIVQYKYNKDLQLGNQTKIDEHNIVYTNTLKSIKSFSFNKFGGIEYVLEGLIYQNNTSNSLYEFVFNSCEGGYNTYKGNWDKKLRDDLVSLENARKKKEEEILAQKKELEVINAFRKSTFELRKNIISGLSENERKKFRKEEKDFIIIKIESLYDSMKQNGWFPPKKGNNKNQVKREILKSYFDKENQNFEFTGFFHDFNGDDPLSNPNNYNMVKFCLGVLELFSKTKE